jgi:uncharacterized protein (DUF2252 family)
MTAQPAAAFPAIQVAERQGRKARLAYGREQRRQMSRKAHAVVHEEKRNFDAIELLCECVAGRIPRLLPIKYGRMAASPFAFFRGAVAIMAADLARRPHSNVLVQLCGDAHLQNMGCFEGPDGRLVFDINDFDETIRGPWEWDVKRMAASIVLAGLESDHSRGECEKAVEAFVSAYCNLIEQLAELPVLEAARHQIRRAKKAPAVWAAIKEAERASPMDLLAKYTEQTSGGKLRFKSIEHILWRVQGRQRAEALEALPVYRESLEPDRLHLFGFFRPLDVGFKVVGTGSVALRDYVVLMQGNGSKDPLFLQIKQEVASAYAPYLQTSTYTQQGQRVAEGQRRIQPLSDPLLGWTRGGEHDFLVRQLNDHKGTVDLGKLRGEGLSSLSGIAGELLARGHARSGDALMIKGYVGSPDKIIQPLVDYGREYAAQTQSDFEEFQKRIRSGRIKTV